jgi:hypothetical protein
MRTNTLLLTLAIGAVSAATSMAQVYSVNAVGYVNVTVRPGFNQICAPMKTTDRTLEGLIPAASNPQADGATYYKFVPGSGYTINTLDISGVGGWDPSGAETIPLGSGGFLLNPNASAFTLTFVGEVAQGTLTHTQPVGFSFISSYVPQSGRITTDLQITPGDGDTVYQYQNDGVNPVGYLINTYDLSGVGGWDPNEPILEVGKSVLITSPTGFTSTRVFSVN